MQKKNKNIDTGSLWLKIDDTLNLVLVWRQILTYMDKLAIINILMEIIIIPAAIPCPNFRINGISIDININIQADIKKQINNRVAVTLNLFTIQFKIIQIKIVKHPKIYRR